MKLDKLILGNKYFGKIIITTIIVLLVVEPMNQVQMRSKSRLGTATESQSFDLLFDMLNDDLKVIKKKIDNKKIEDANKNNILNTRFKEIDTNKTDKTDKTEKTDKTDKTENITNQNNKKTVPETLAFNLKTKAAILLELNQKLKSKLNDHPNNAVSAIKNHKADKTDKTDKKHQQSNNIHNNVDLDVLSFIQKGDSNLNNLNTEFNEENKLKNNSIQSKENQTRLLFESTLNNLKKLEQLTKDVKNKLNRNEEKFDKNLEKYNGKKPKDIKLDRLSVSKKIDVDGHGNISRISAGKFELGSNMKISNDDLEINKNMKLIVGKEILSLDDILEKFKLFKKLQGKCGEDFSQCSVYTKEEFLKHDEKNKSMLTQLKWLRSQTNGIINKEGFIR